MVDIISVVLQIKNASLQRNEINKLSVIIIIIIIIIMGGHGVCWRQNYGVRNSCPWCVCIGLQTAVDLVSHCETLPQA